MDAVTMANGDRRVLDYVPRLVEANLQYLVADHAEIQEKASLHDLMTLRRNWTGGAVLDQGEEGSCVGHGVVGEYLASPVRGRGNAQTGHELAVRVYDRAKEVDEYEGVDYDGTSVRAGMLVGREHGWWDSFSWNKNVRDVRASLEVGPVVVGVTWTENMYEAQGGLVRTGGKVVGGHCLLIDGFDPDWGGIGPCFRWRNSWNLPYGIQGNAMIRVPDFKAVCFDDGGEAAVAVGRHIGTE